MIESSDLLSLQFLKKSRFTGSYRGMRYCVREKDKELGVCCWPGPFAMEKTKEELFTEGVFPFTEEGRESCVAWLNNQYRQKEEFYEDVFAHPSAYMKHRRPDTEE